MTRLQMDENQGCPPSEPGLKETMERLQHLQEGWSRAEEQVWLCSLFPRTCDTAYGTWLVNETSYARQRMQQMRSAPCHDVR